MGLLEVSHPEGLQQKKLIANRTKDGEVVTNGDVSHAHSNGSQASHHGDAFAVRSLRNLIFDICNQNGGGHGGSAIGMAAIGTALFKYIMRYNPSNPDWFDRDRFVLSNGMLLCTVKSFVATLTLLRPRGNVSVRIEPSRWLRCVDDGRA